jgi:catechol 2,3-dioxygenase
MDTPWYVSQPHGKPFDLSLSDEEIYTFTKNLITNNPTFKNQDDWRTQMQEKLLQVNANIQ